MGTLETLGIALGMSWTAGINLYATVAALGLAHSMNLLVLPPDLQVLADPIVITVAIVLYLVEFVADKVPVVDSAWDAVHTFIRVPAGALLAASALGPLHPGLEVAAALAGGTVSLAAHGTKAATRLAINTSPEPFSNWAASFTEDIAVLGSIWMIFNHPIIMLALLCIFMALVIWLVPKIFRAAKRGFQALRNKIRELGSLREKSVELQHQLETIENRGRDIRQRFGHADGHLGVVGVPHFLARISDQLVGACETCANGFPALTFEASAERIANRQAEEILQNARIEGEAAQKTIELEAEKRARERRDALDQEIASALADLKKDQQRLAKREDTLDKKLESLTDREKSLERRDQQLKRLEGEAQQVQSELELLRSDLKRRLQELSKLTEQQAKDLEALEGFLNSSVLTEVFRGSDPQRQIVRTKIVHLLIQNHLQSDQLGSLVTRLSMSPLLNDPAHEQLLRTILEKSPHHAVRGGSHGRRATRLGPAHHAQRSGLHRGPRRLGGLADLRRPDAPRRGAQRPGGHRPRHAQPTGWCP